jgi:hypothetical protein
MLATSQYTASLVACRATSYDFTKPIGERRLFRHVEMTTTPVAPETEAKIRENIKYLYFRLLGETVDVQSEEVSRTYALFADVWRDHQARDAAGNGNNKRISNYRCQAQDDWDKGATFAPDANGNIRASFPKLRERPNDAPYEPGMRLDRDENFTVRSWQAVVTYLLQDYRFTHE